MGLGLHGGGVGTARFLVEAGAQVTVTDLKSAKELKPSLTQLQDLPIKYVLGKHRKKDFSEADLVMKNPGVPDHSPFLAIAQEHHIPIETDLGLFLQLCPSPHLIGITGTKGKSTTTTLVYEILKRTQPDTQIAGNIRVSPFTILPQIRPETLVILELSSWQLEGLAQHKMSPHLACITNIFPDHLNRYPDLHTYAEAKKNIFKFQKAGDYVIMNYDCAILREPFFNYNLKNIYWFSRKKELRQGTFIRRGGIILRERNLDHRLLSVRDIKLPGKHNLENVLAAITVAWLAGARRGTIPEVVREFRGLADRLESIREWKGVRYVNDTTSTTPLSTVAALKSFAAPLILIAGGADKNLDFRLLAQTIARRVKALILLNGEATPRLLAAVNSALRKTTRKLPITQTDTLEAAVSQAQTWAVPGDIVLLSPACASFGMFQNEFDRGAQFKTLVQKLKLSKPQKIA